MNKLIIRKKNPFALKHKPIVQRLKNNRLNTDIVSTKYELLRYLNIYKPDIILINSISGMNINDVEPLIRKLFEFTKQDLPKIFIKLEI